MKISAENYIGAMEEKKISIEIPDDSGINELMETFYSIGVALTYHPNTMIEAFRAFAEERIEEEAIDEIN